MHGAKEAMQRAAQAVEIITMMMTSQPIRQIRTNAMSWRFHNALNKWGRENFAYGTRDCCQFTSFIVKEMTGVDYAEQFTYQSEKTAYQIVDEHEDLVGLFTHLLGEKNTAKVDGDPCIVNVEGVGQIAGVKYKEGVICLLKKGFVSISDEFVVAGWSVCHR